MKQYVDLGLPSGIKWATCNIGADVPEGNGDYFAWGEVEPKYTYSWATYKWCNGSSSTFTKYNTSSSFGTADNKTVLDLEDDAAHANWGSKWRMPTNEEWEELRSNCTWTWATIKGTRGYEVKGPNGNSIFLPAAGYRYLDDLCSVGDFGQYWSNSLYMGYPFIAWIMLFDSDYMYMDNYYRYYGMPIRPVYVDQNPKEKTPNQEFDWSKISQSSTQENNMKEMADWTVIRKTCLYLEGITKCPVELTGSYILKKGGLIDRAPSDVDIRIAMDSTKFEHLCYLLQGKPAGNSDYGVNSFYIERGRVTLNLCLVQTLNTAFKWDEVNVTSYDHIIKWKLDHQREKDLKDLVIIKERLSKVENCFKYQVNKDTVNRLIAVVERYLSNEAKKSVQ